MKGFHVEPKAAEMISEAERLATLPGGRKAADALTDLAPLYSIAISLKRIADEMERVEITQAESGSEPK